MGTARATREGGVYASVANFGAFTKSVVALGRRTGAAELIDAAKRFGNADVQKAVQLSKFDSAGVLVPIQQSGELLEFLRPDAALLKLGVRAQAFKGELHMGTQTGTSVFKWVGEGENVPRSAPKYGKIVLKAHKGMVLTDISNDLLRTPGVGDAGVGEDIRATVADGLDDAGFNGDGTGAAPKGLFVQLDAAQVFASDHPRDREGRLQAAPAEGVQLDHLLTRQPVTGAARTVHAEDLSPSSAARRGRVHLGRKGVPPMMDAPPMSERPVTLQAGEP